ncbi:MAG: IclR family transcriptional regulator [Actinomycetota bacterium]|nr:IclR family transcriptional regulator [Actinomycetota bacterium]
MSTTLVKGLDLLMIVARAKPGGLRLVDLQREVGADKAVLVRLLNGLQIRDFVRRDDGARYHLGPAAMELAHSFLAGIDVRAAAVSTMRRLVAESGETVHLGALRDVAVIYLDKIEAEHTIRMHSQIGSLMPAYSTALGKAMLAAGPPELVDRTIGAGMPARTPRTITTPEALRRELETVRARGFAIDDLENEDGVRCVGAAILDHQGAIAGALSVSAPAFRFSLEDALRLGPQIAWAAQEVSEQLGSPGGFVEDTTFAAAARDEPASARAGSATRH